MPDGKESMTNNPENSLCKVVRELGFSGVGDNTKPPYLIKKLDELRRDLSVSSELNDSEKYFVKIT